MTLNRNTMLGRISHDFIFIVAVLAIVIFGASSVDYIQCKSKWVSYGPTFWGPVQGCMVKLEGSMYPADIIREVPKTPRIPTTEIIQ